jgi:transcriptional regulator with XRE-family HTH domain
MCKSHICQGEKFYMHKEIGKRVEQVREYFGLTRKQFIQIVKVNLSTVSRIEAGKQPPSEVFLDALLARFLVDPDWVKTGDGEMFITAEEHMANGIKALGVKKYGQGLMNVLREPQFAELQSLVAFGEVTKESIDPKLQAYLQYILDKWHQGDETVRGWLMIQLGIAFQEVAARLREEKKK